VLFIVGQVDYVGVHHALPRGSAVSAFRRWGSLMRAGIALLEW